MNWHLLQNSLTVGATATVLATVFGLVAAVAVASLERSHRHWLLGGGVVALAMPPFLVTNCWLHYLGAGGVWRGVLDFNLFTLWGCAWILALLLWPITLFLVCSELVRVPAEQFEADSAVSGWPLFRHVVWPAVRRSLALAAALTFVLALNNFAVPAILQVKVLPAEMWIRFNTVFDARGALALSVPLIIGPLGLVFWAAKSGRTGLKLFQPAFSPRLFRRQAGPGMVAFCRTATGAICILSTVLPLFQIALTGRTWSELPGALAAGHRAVASSMAYAAIAACLCVTLPLALALCGSFGESPGKLRGAGLLRVALWVPFLVPGIFLGILWIKLFGWMGALYQGSWIVITAMVARYLGVAWTGVTQAQAGVDRRSKETARVLGANHWQLFRHVVWPQISRQTLACAYAVYLLCLWDVESILLVVPPGVETLAMRIFNLLHYGHNAQVNALCATLLLLALLPLGLWCFWGALNSQWRRLATIVPGLALLAGCDGGSSPPALHSRFFDRVQLVGSRGVGVGQFNKPRSLTLDRQDNCYVVDMTGRVQKFSPEGAFLLLWQMPQTDLGKPKGMCRDEAGNVVVLEPHYQRVNHYNTNGAVVAQWGERGTNAGQFILPRAVACNSQGEVIVTEYGLSERVQIFARGSHRFLTAFGSPGLEPGQFNRAEGVCVDRADRIYVADSCNHRIQIFSPEGKLLRTYGRAGSGLGELSYPYDICVDAAGFQFVCEFGNSRIQVFDSQDRPVEIIGGPGGRPGEFNNPWSIALDSKGNLYVADALNHRVQKLIRSAAATGNLRLTALR